MISGSERRAVGKASIAAVVILAGGATILLVVSPLLTGNSSSSTTTITVVARAIDANGDLVTNATYKLGQEILLSVTVPNATAPVAVHQVFSGRAYGDLVWNVTSTHDTYVIDSGPADAADLGVNPVYVIVSFANGSAARSNNVTMTVTQ